MFARVLNGAKWGLSFDNKKIKSEGVIIMTGETYTKEWDSVLNFLKKHDLFEAFYEDTASK